MWVEIHIKQYSTDFWTNSIFLPFPADNKIELFLILNKFSFEKTKKKLDVYYTVRSFIPEFFVSTYVSDPKLRDMMDLMWDFLNLKNYYFYKSNPFLKSHLQLSNPSTETLQHLKDFGRQSGP